MFKVFTGYNRKTKKIVFVLVKISYYIFSTTIDEFETEEEAHQVRDKLNE